MGFYELTFKDSFGKDFDMNTLRGKIVLIVNTATKCGLANQFNQLEELNQKYKDKGLFIIGFPSNQFMNQEPETDENMVSSCKLNFGVTFLLSQKIDVNGNDTHPVFKFLKQELHNIFSKDIKWNFTKFLIDQNGKPYKRYSPTTNPINIEKDIIKLMHQKIK